MDCLDCGTPLTGSVVRCIPCAEAGVQRWVVERDIERKRLENARLGIQVKNQLKERMTRHRTVRKV